MKTKVKPREKLKNSTLQNRARLSISIAPEDKDAIQQVADLYYHGNICFYARERLVEDAYATLAAEKRKKE